MDDEAPITRSLILAGSLFGLFPALLLNLLAFCMSGGGHGWCTPIWPSFTALLGFPVLGVLASIPPAKEKFPWSLALLVAAVGADVYLFFGTVAEGALYFWTALSFAWPAALAWFVLWFGAQIIAVVGCVRAFTAYAVRRSQRDRRS